jgi:uncharacterized PurR-regulated membrane protein YhhQ (DUF165 family)
MRTTLIAAGAYAIAMTLANLSIVQFGPSVIPLNAFVLIGMDLALRDWLHVHIKEWQMGLLIAVSGGITYALNPMAAHIAVASAVAFMAAALVDWAVFASMRGSWIKRANASNTAGALVDSIVFPALAFGGLDAKIVAMMFLAKVAGGAIWSLMLRRYA